MTVNDANLYIKQSLNAFCAQNAPERSFEVKMPHVLYLERDEFEELSKLKICFNFVLANLRFEIINLSSKYYFIVAGDRELICDNSDFVETKITNSIFLSCVESMNLRVPSHINAYDIMEKIYVPDNDTDDGYQVEILSEFFEPIKAYEIPEEIAQSNDTILTAIGKIIVSNVHLKNLPFSESTINSYSRFFESGNFDFNVINSYLSYCWQYSFLDAYRCLEPIFRHIYLPQLKAELDITVSIDELGESLDKYCGWRPQETGSMQLLFDDSNPLLSEALIIRFKNLGIGASPNEKIGKFVYQLRNKIVHYQNRYNQSESILTINQWDQLIGCVIDAIIELRIKFPQN